MRKERGITLIALVITIIILLILAGITITLVLGDNGILNKAKMAGEESIKAALKEEIELAIMDIQAEEIPQGKDVTLETLAGGQLQGKLVGITAQLSYPGIVGEYKGYDYTIDDNYHVVIGPKIKGIGITCDISTTEYTNQDVLVKVNATTTNGTIVSIQAPSELTQNADGSYTITKNGNYEFTVTDSSGASEKQIITIANIDKIAPKDVTISVKEIGTREFTIEVNAEDEEETIENAKSGIEKYEYYLKKVGETDYIKYEAKQGSYKVDNLAVGTQYSIYVTVYDKAGNSKTSQEIKQQTEVGPQDIYVDAINGNDTTGEGTKEKPFATLQPMKQTGMIRAGVKYNVYLADGAYSLIPEIISLNCDQSINIYGNKEKTVLTLPTEGLGINAGSGGTNKYSLNFYRLVLKLDSTTRGNYWCCSNKLTFHNIVFINNESKNCSISFFYLNLTTTTGEINNCIAIGNSIRIRCDKGKISVRNSYGNFTSGYGTTQAKWDYETNYIKTVTQVDTSNYQITEEESKWKNVGTGSNPDGSQANIGVYGGEYSWEK